MADKNKRSSASFVPFKPLDNLFEPTVQEKPAPAENGLTNLSVDDLHSFKDHPFRLYAEDKMAEMVESVQEHGVITPILVRPAKDGDGYEIISGHNRVEACRIAGIETIPATIRDLDDDTAIILMVDSNLKQREKLLPTERAKALQMKLEAIKRQGARTDLTSDQVDRKLSGKESREIVAEGAGMSSAQVTRFIRLNSLIPALQEAVDEGRLAFNPAVEVSYLDEADQEIVQEIMDRDQISPSLSQAQKLHRLSQIDKIDDNAIEAVMTVEKPMYETITFRRNTVEKYFPAGTTGKEIEQTIIRLLENYSRQREASICFSKATVTALQNSERIRIEVNNERKLILITPATESDRNNVRWAKIGKDVSPRRIDCKAFTVPLYDQWGWNKNFVYRAMGRLVISDKKLMMLFDFNKIEKWEYKTRIK